MAKRKVQRAPLNYRRYATVADAMAHLEKPCQFAMGYGSNEFNMRVKDSPSPSMACHPVVTSDGIMLTTTPISTILALDEFERRYKMFVDFLSANSNLTIVSSIEDLKNEQRVEFACGTCKTITSYKWITFYMKRYKKSPAEFCTVCN